ncbi:uncharacterized protein LOC119341193 isoform X2 [Triticum dicoccoides]|uniref:uncharacterized protein LOC119341193 isoform X2 n=1 Tax=Triticum dicoccoides TaxID=85692 RepID=UPI001891776D|nr:uncharacterized protein LOC119341193 isoform X2 [Triticum dicoccoides]
MRSSAGGEAPHGNGGRGGAALDADGEFLLDPVDRFPLREEFADSLEQPNPDTLGFLRPSMATGLHRLRCRCHRPSPSTPTPPLLSTSQSRRGSSLPWSPLLDSCSAVSSFSCTGWRHLILRHQQVHGPMVLHEISSPAASIRHHGSCEAPSMLLWSISTTPAMPML